MGLKRNLMTKLMAQMVIAVVSVAVILGGGSYFITKASMEKQIYAAVRSEVQLRATTIVNELEALESLAAVIALEDSVVESLKNPVARPEAMGYFKEIQGRNGDLIEMIVLVDASGKALLDHTSVNLNINIADRSYFKKLMETKAPVISDVVVSKSTGNKVVVVAVPVLKGTSVEGVVLTTVAFDQIRETVKAAKVGENGYGYMADASGLVLSHKDESKEMTMLLGDVAKDNAEFALLWDKMQNQDTGEGHYTYAGIRKFVAFSKAGPWTIALTADEVDYLAPVFAIRNMTYAIGISLAVIALISTYIFTRFNIVKPLTHLKEAMALAGQGDFTGAVTVRGKDEIAEISTAFMAMRDSQRAMISEMRLNAEQLNQMAEELNASSQEVSATSEEMTAAIEVIAHHTDDQATLAHTTGVSLQALDEGIVTSAALVEDALASSKACTEEAIAGKKALTTSQEGMAKIDAVTTETVKVLHHLAEQATGVSSISQTIQQIASQINLLALNASIEAARAGEHGRGFSVVADEVRKLAEQTTAESGLITESLNGILQTVVGATEVVDAMRAQVDEGNAAIAGTQEAIERLYQGVESMIALNEAVLYSNQGERALVEQTKSEMTALDKMTTGIAASAQEISASTEEQAAITESLTQVAEETSKMAEAVFNMLAQFKL